MPFTAHGAEPECPALGTQRHGVAEGRAFQSNRAVVARHRGAQLCDGLISADVSDFDATGDHIAWANGSGEIPINIEKYAPRSRELLCDDRVQDCAGYATLDHDLPESRRRRRQKVVVQRIAITADLVNRSISVAATVRRISATSPTLGAPFGHAELNVSRPSQRRS